MGLEPQRDKRRIRQKFIHGLTFKFSYRISWIVKPVIFYSSAMVTTRMPAIAWPTDDERGWYI